MRFTGLRYKTRGCNGWCFDVRLQEPFCLDQRHPNPGPPPLAACACCLCLCLLLLLLLCRCLMLAAVVPLLAPPLDAARSRLLRARAAEG